MTLPCPYCRKRIHILEHDIMSEAGRISGTRGTPGRKPVMRQCPKCGAQHSAREMRKCKGYWSGSALIKRVMGDDNGQ